MGGGEVDVIAEVESSGGVLGNDLLVLLMKVLFQSGRAFHPDQGREEVGLYAAVAEHSHGGEVGFCRHSGSGVENVAVFLSVIRNKIPFIAAGGGQKTTAS